MRVWIWTLALSLCVYLNSSFDRIGGGDSGELMAEVCVGGVAHPPGYPLLLLLLRLARSIGLMSCPRVAFVVIANMGNAVLAAVAAACIAQAVYWMTHHAVEAIAAGLWFTISKLAWEYAISLEVERNTQSQRGSLCKQ